MQDYKRSETELALIAVKNHQGFVPRNVSKKDSAMRKEICYWSHIVLFILAVWSSVAIVEERLQSKLASKLGSQTQRLVLLGGILHQPISDVLMHSKVECMVSRAELARSILYSTLYNLLTLGNREDTMAVDCVA